MTPPAVAVAGPGPFEGLTIEEVARIIIECFVNMPLQQMLACGEDAYVVPIDDDGDPTAPPVGYVTIIDGEDEPVSAFYVTADGHGLRGCWCGLNKWDALVPR